MVNGAHKGKKHFFRSLLSCGVVRNLLSKRGGREKHERQNVNFASFSTDNPGLEGDCRDVLQDYKGLTSLQLVELLGVNTHVVVCF